MSRFFRIPRIRRGSWAPYLALVVLGSIPVMVLAVFAYVVSARAVESFVHRGNEAAATITAAMVEREFEHWTATLTSHAGFPTLSAAATAGDSAEVRRRLEIFVSAHQRLDRAFVTDTTGLLWVDYPVAPESLNRSFDQRDWFRGIRETASSGSAYVSEVYRRNAEPRILVVAVAAPIRTPATGELAGFLVAQVRLDELAGLLGRVEVGDDGIVLLRDHSGILAAHPAFDIAGPPRDDYADVLSGGESGEPSRGSYADPLTGDTVLATAVRARVGSHEWTVISQQPLDMAFAPVRDLAVRLGAAGLLAGALLGILLWGVAREYSRRRKAEGELIALNGQLEQRVAERTAALKDKEGQLVQAQKMEAVGRLAGGVAHDFNNLLTVILGCSDLLLLELDDDAPERREVEQVSEAAERASNLTRQLLAFSRKQVMQPKVIDVNESVEAMRGILDRVIGEDIDLACSLNPDLHPVKFDPGQIEQVIMNLAVNARDAMPRGGKLTIETSNVELDDDYVEEHVDARAGPHVMLAVTDTGCGMDTDTREKIFEPFFTTKKFGQGTGLGLSTVYGIVRQGGGNIWVYSEPGRGTTFKIFLPRVERESTRPSVVPKDTIDLRGSETVLVVEDEPAVRELTRRILESAGYRPIVAANGSEALLECEGHEAKVRLLLTDVVMPKMSGKELAERLEKLSPGLRVLYMSGYTDNAIVHHGMLDAGTHFIAKPFDAASLLKKVRQVLDMSGDSTDAPSQNREGPG